MSEQHDDHIWLTIFGEAWAIHGIHRRDSVGMTFGLWRGYEPNIEHAMLTASRIDWTAYCAAALKLLEREAGRKLL